MHRQAPEMNFEVESKSQSTLGQILFIHSKAFLSNLVLSVLLVIYLWTGKFWRGCWLKRDRNVAVLKRKCDGCHMSVNIANTSSASREGENTEIGLNIPGAETTGAFLRLKSQVIPALIFLN